MPKQLFKTSNDQHLQPFDKGKSDYCRLFTLVLETEHCFSVSPNSKQWASRGATFYHEPALKM